MSDPNHKPAEKYLRKANLIYGKADAAGNRTLWRECTSITQAKRAVRTELKFNCVTK